MIARFGISLTVGAFVTTFIIRSLSVKDYGIYTVLYSMIHYVSVIGSFGIPEVFRRFIPEAMQKKDYSLLRRLVLRGLILRVLLSVLTVGLMLLLHGPIGRLLKLENFLNYFSIFAFGIVLSLEAGLMTNVLHSLFLHKYSVIASTLHTIFRGASIYVLLKLDWGIQGILWAEVASWGMWTLLQVFFYYSKFLKRQPKTGTKTPFPMCRFFRYGGLSSLNELGSSVLSVSTDFFVITAFLGPAAVALYAFANRVIQIFANCMPHVMLIDVIRPTFFAKYAESGDKKHLAGMFNLLVKLSAFFVFPLAGGMYVLGGKMIAVVFKPEYMAAKPILWIMITLSAIGIFIHPTGLVLQAIEKVQIILYSKIFAVFNLIVELMVIRRFGVMSVVVVTCSAVLMKNVFCYYHMKRCTGIGVQWRALSIIGFNSGVMSLFLWALRPLVDSVFTLAMVSAGGIICYLFASFANKAFTAAERGSLNGVARYPVFVF